LDRRSSAAPAKAMSRLIVLPVCSNIVRVLNARGGVVRLNKGGLIACAFYTLHFAIFFGWSLFASLKASVLLIVIAIFPAALFFSVLEVLLGVEISVDSWTNNNFIYYLVSLLISYCVGWISGAIVLRSAVQPQRSGDISDWHKR
jgi:hypothetical protein